MYIYDKRKKKFVPIGEETPETKPDKDDKDGKPDKDDVKV